jgi:DNA-binding GntR family transcriptional regulator
MSASASPVADSTGQTAPAGAPLGRVSTVEATVAVLRSRILGADIAAGASIPEEQTAAELGVSRHSLRAAMRRLVEEGLLRHEPHRGVRVPVLDRADIEDVYRMRRVLELEATRTVAGAGIVPVEAVAAVAALEALTRGAGWDEVVLQDLRFHRAVIDAAGSPRLARAYRATQSEVAYCLTQLRPHYDRPAQVAAEHRELLEPVASSDPEAACRLLIEHLLEAEQNLLGALPGGGDGSPPPN